jgi:hypothetical protein
MRKRITYGGALVLLATLACALAGSATAGTRADLPTITDFTPKSGVAGTKVTITGSNFGGASVTFAYSQATVSSIAPDGSSLVALVPAEAQAGPNKITITALGGSATATGVFTVIGAKPHLPRVTGFTPASGKAGTRVQLHGNFFNSATAVKFGGVKTPFKVKSANWILATVSTKSKSGKISVTTGSGTGTSAKSFTVKR